MSVSDSNAMKNIELRVALPAGCRYLGRVSEARQLPWSRVSGCRTGREVHGEATRVEDAVDRRGGAVRDAVDGMVDTARAAGGARADGRGACGRGCGVGWRGPVGPHGHAPRARRRPARLPGRPGPRPHEP